jgi:hypothetical protein
MVRAVVLKGPRPARKKPCRSIRRHQEALGQRQV